MGGKPPIVAVVLDKGVHDLSLPALAARCSFQADEATDWLVNAKHSGITRPGVEVCACGFQSGPDPACEQLLENAEMACFTIAELEGGSLGRGERSLRRRNIAP